MHATDRPEGGRCHGFKNGAGQLAVNFLGRVQTVEEQIAAYVIATEKRLGQARLRYAG